MAASLTQRVVPSVTSSPAAGSGPVGGGGYCVVRLGGKSPSQWHDPRHTDNCGLCSTSSPRARGRTYEPFDREPDRSGEEYRRALGLAREAARLVPTYGPFVNTLGVALFRTGDFEAALETLTRSDKLQKGSHPADAAFLARAHHRLGNKEAANEALERLRKLLADPKRAGDEESQAFLREAEALIGGD